MSRERITWKEAASLSIGDRALPLEVDLQTDVRREGFRIGTTAEVSPIAGGDLYGLKGKSGEIKGVLYRLGQEVGYEVEIEGSVHSGSRKDFFVDREVLEDIQPPTPTSAAVREGLSHWETPRTYWQSRCDGLESLCFELASNVAAAIPVASPWGWQFWIPDPMPGRHSIVDCRANIHGSFWTLGVAVYPVTEVLPPVSRVEDHWDRTLGWSLDIVRGMIGEGFPWERVLKGMEARVEAINTILRPLVADTLARVCQETGSLPPPKVSAAFSSVRLKAGTVGLVEPPTDRRPYSVLSISPTAAKDREYLEQVVLHECIHIAVASKGGKPHNEEFMRLSEVLGLKPEHRD